MSTRASKRVKREPKPPPETYSFRKFILKDMKAREEELVVGGRPSMDRPLVTLGNLREHIKFTRHIPFEKQRFVCQGRSYSTPHEGWHTATDDVPLDKVLGDEKDDDPDYPTYIWLIWLSEDDFMGFVDEKDTIGFVYENEVETKRQKYEKKGKKFSVVPLRTYQVITTLAINSYEHYHNLNVDPDTLVRDC